MRTALVTSTLLASLVCAKAAHAQEFEYNPPGTLTAGSGEGRFDETVYAPNMRFPIEETPAFLNSQVWGVGGSQGPGGSQCDVANFSYPWWDNYCETRSWDMPLCPAGVGHQGQDMRASDCEKDVHWVVASEAGSVTNVGSYSVYVTAADGTRYDYLHMGSVQVQVGDEVAKGQQIGKVSNEFGGTPTSVHLHFNLRQNVAGVGNVYVPPYMSLVTSYQALIGPPPNPPAGALDEVTCDALRGWVQSPNDPTAPIDVRFHFDGGADSTVGHPFLADLSRDDLCAALGSCEHAFQIPPPLSLFDGGSHEVRAYASDGTAALPELSGSPLSMSCTFELPSGVRRRVADLDAANAWRFSPFWDEISVSDGVVAALDEGLELDLAPRLVASTASPEELFVIDAGFRRPVGDEVTAAAWQLHPLTAELLSDEELKALPEGKPLRSRPIVLVTASGELWLVDDTPGPNVPGAGGNGAGGGDDGAKLEDEGGADCNCRAPASRSGSGGLAAALAALGLATLRVRRSVVRWRRPKAP
jgi:hypothetical protein